MSAFESSDPDAYETGPGSPPPVLPLEKEDRLWATAAHLAGPASAVLSAGSLSWLGPLIIWLVKRDESRFAAEEAKEALNFQITLFLLFVAAMIVTAVGAIVTVGIGLVVLVPVWIIGAIVVAIASFVLGILAAVSAYDGKPYRYPLTVRLL